MNVPELSLTLELHAKGLPKQSWVKISQIRTLAVELGRRSEGHLQKKLLR